MADLRKLIQQLASQEKLLSETEFLAPCVGGGLVRTSVEKIVYTFKIKPVDFVGWGIFQAINNQEAEVIDEPTLPQINEYLNLLTPLRLRLADQLPGQSWLAYPINESDMQQRFQMIKPIPVHLVTEGTNFEVIVARCDGNCWWFAEIDRNSDPQLTTILNEQFQQELSPENLQFSKMTPEMLTTYSLVWQQTASYRQKKQIITEEKRLKNALKQGGGELENYRDRGEYWQVEWRTADGEYHTSAIDKKELTVISSGICLSGRDRDFDLQSLVGVIENRTYWE